MAYTGIKNKLKQNHLLRKRYRNAYRLRRLDLNKPKSSGHSYFSTEQIKGDRERLKDKLKRELKHKSIIGAILLSIIFILGLIYFNPTLLLP